MIDADRRVAHTVTSGTATVGGFDVVTEPDDVRKLIGYVTGSAGIYDRMTAYEMVEYFGKLPGIGKKSAERLAYHVLRMHESEALALADAIRRVKTNVRYCKCCYNLTEEETCSICCDSKREKASAQERSVESRI